MAEPSVRILFVCLGNICRSPTAEAVFKREVENAGLTHAIWVDSAGTGSWHIGEPADDRSRNAAARRGVTIDSLARRVTPEDFRRFDYLVAMDRSNRDNLLGAAPDSVHRRKVYLFRSFDTAAPAHAEVPDPYFGGEDGFDHVFDLCVAASRGLLEAICRDHGLEPRP